MTDIAVSSAVRVTIPRYRFALPNVIGHYHTAPSPSSPYQKVTAAGEDAELGAVAASEGRYIAEFYVVPIIGRRA